MSACFLLRRNVTKLVVRALWLGTALALTACVTVADRVPGRQDLIGEGKLEGRSVRPAISLEVRKPHSMDITLQFDDTDNYSAHYNYDPNIVAVTVEALSRYYDIVPPDRFVPRVVVEFERLYASGSCSTTWGSTSDCSQGVQFDALVKVSQGVRSAEPEKIVGHSTATEGGYLWLPNSFDPLHRKAAKQAFENFVNWVVVVIDEDLVSLQDAV
ncbi:hypothetical protein EOI86_20550 [Hwanghaeella grinnelliae]|uniref:Uncharacterized protein n=1 Tax=Hwanghaeella grinnelliae TaxID=2500179 RepID=A0A437QL27_9PROT|nr:hypothetical protein [Hwanghaeella grinnelliae]RVU35207.1 hypothetical protein EOI86_20550 [Hwanghaeella grinnelliae]